jgi:hypothetical protein
MATLKNPSIYDDRSTIGSAEELDEYGVWVKIEPEELSDTEEEQFPDFDADFAPDIPLDETALSDADFEDPAYPGNGEDIDFDDVEALRQDIESPFPDEPPNDAEAEPAMDESAGTPVAEPAPALAETPTARPTAGPPDLSTQLLMKIADELSSIKEELSTLKGELSAIRSEKPAHSAAGAEAEDAGFFGEEDDDKIALTGDELDNIIHTAAFTEETGFDAGASPADDFATPDIPAPSFDEPLDEPSGDSGEIIYDGLGRPLRAASPESRGNDAPGPAANPTAEAVSDSGGAQIIYDGLGRPLNRNISEDDSAGTSLDANEPDDLKALRENGVEPMTAAPEDTSYLEEDPLAEENLDLSDAIIDEPDLSEGVKDTPLEEPSLDNLSLIDLETIDDGAPPPGKDEETIEERPFFEDITFEDLSDPEGPLNSESITGTENPGEEETIDLSVFEDDFLLGDADGLDGSADVAEAGELSFEVLDEDTELPVQQNIQDNVITEDSFESISFDDDGELSELMIDDDLEQSLPEDMKLELDFPSFEIEDSIPKEEEEAEDDKNFDLPGSADTADAGESAIVTAEVPPAVRMELRDVLIYMDKLLESLPEEKINEFAQSEHYNTYKKLFEELGIQQ